MTLHETIDAVAALDRCDGVISICFDACSGRSIHVRSECFIEAFGEQERSIHGAEYDKLTVVVDEVEVFCLIEKEPA